MPTFQIFGTENGREGGWDQFNNYDLNRTSATSWRLVWDEEDNGPRDEEYNPAEIRITIADGIITRISYFADDGTLLARMAGLSMNAQFFAWAVSDDGLGGDAIFDLLSRGGLAVTGGAQANDQWDHHDDITTSAFNDRVNALSGNDYIKDRGGADIYNGGTGWDTVSYQEWQWRNPVFTTGIRVDLAAGTVRGPDGRTDTLVGIESIQATYQADILLGSDRADNFNGGRGRDYIDGRGGRDWVAYDDLEEGPGVTVDLRTGVGIDQYGFRDTLVRVENVWGGSGDDKLTDNGRRNDLVGNEGDDRLVFAGGDDWGQGGEGADRFIFQGTAFGNDFIDDFNPEDGDRIRISAATSAASLTIEQEDEGTRISLDEDNSVFLWQYFGSVEPYLLFS